MGKTTLHFLCGKIAAGKTTLAKKLCLDEDALLISQDFWMSTLYPENKSVADYLHRAPMLGKALSPHLISILQKEISVVLDFPANTPGARNWMREIFTQASCDHVLHFLNVDDETCRARMRQRNTTGVHEYALTDEQFDQITALFVKPEKSEGFNIREYRDDAP